MRAPSLPCSLKSLTKKVVIVKRRNRTLKIAYDVSIDNEKMSVSISLFSDYEELFHDSNVVHGIPPSSIRAELFGVIMALHFSREQTS